MKAYIEEKNCGFDEYFPWMKWDESFKSKYRTIDLLPENPKNWAKTNVKVRPDPSWEIYGAINQQKTYEKPWEKSPSKHLVLKNITEGHSVE